MANKGLGKPASDTCVLVTGGAGFIGTHTVLRTLDRGYNVVVVDNLYNSKPEAIRRVRKIAGLAEDNPRLVFVEADIIDRDAMDKVFAEHDIDAIIHFAGYKAVGESVQKPLEYYWNNIAGTLAFMDVARSHGVKNVIFSSSATVYGEPDSVPVARVVPQARRHEPLRLDEERVERVTDLYVGDDEWNVVLLRYFNPIGAHESGLIGEERKGIPNNPVRPGASGHREASCGRRVRQRSGTAETARACATTSTWST